MSFDFFCQGKYEQVEQLEQRSLAISKRAPENQLLMGSTLGLLGLVYREQGKYEQTEFCLQQSLSLTKQVYGEDHIYTQQAMVRLAGLYREQGEYERAESLLSIR